MHTAPLRAAAVVLASLLGAARGAPAQEPGPGVRDALETAAAHCSRREWQAAIALLDGVLQQRPDDLDALRWRGHAFTGSQQHERARADLARALAAGADDAWTHYAHAMALHHLGELERAVRGYTDALAIDPDFAKPYEWRGFTLARLGRPVQALPDLTTGIGLDPGNTWLRAIRAKVLATLGDVVAAEEDLWRAADAAPANADVLAQLGYLLIASGQPEAGRRQLERAFELDAAAHVEARAWTFHVLANASSTVAAARQLELLAAAKGDAAEWHAAVAAFLRGETDAARLLTSAGAAPEAERRARRCAAWLHVGLLAQRAARTEDALVAFARAVAVDARDQWEWLWAQRSLRQAAGEL